MVSGILFNAHFYFEMENGPYLTILSHNSDIKFLQDAHVTFMS